MTFFTPLRRLKAIAECGRPGQSRRRRVPPHWIPRLEALEDRTVLSTLTVTNPADDGSSGTLRAVLAGAQSGDTIRFAHQLMGQTIILIHGQLIVNQSLDLVGLGPDSLTINGNAAGRIFDVSGGVKVSISGLTLEQG